MHPGFVPSNHPNQVKKRGVDDSIDDRETPPCVFDPLHAEFGFTLDVAASHFNHKCPVYCTLEGTWHRSSPEAQPVLMLQSHGLQKEWRGERVWDNPPFSNLLIWTEKHWDDPAEVSTLLLPANRQEQPFWQKNIEPFRDKPGSILTTRFLAKRRPFLHMGKGIGNRTSKSPPFGLVVCIWDRRGPRARWWTPRCAEHTGNG